MGLDANRALHPARKLLVARVAAFQLFGADRQNLGKVALELVADADLYRVDPVEYVELGDAQAGDAVQLDRALERRSVEPAGAPRPAGGGAEFLSALAQVLPDVVRELGRERPAADARRIRLCNADHIVQVVRADARAGRRGAGDAVRRGDERVRAVVDVEERALRAFEEQVLSGAVRMVEGTWHVGDQRREARGERKGLVKNLPPIELWLLVVVLQDKIVEVEQLAQLLREACGLEKVL